MRGTLSHWTRNKAWFNWPNSWTSSDHVAAGVSVFISGLLPFGMLMSGGGTMGNSRSAGEVQAVLAAVWQRNRCAIERNATQLNPLPCGIARRWFGTGLGWLGCGIHIVERERYAQAGRVCNKSTRHVGRNGLSLVFVMTHIALRAANGLGKRCLSQSEAGSDGFDGIHKIIMSATCKQVNTGNVLFF